MFFNTINIFFEFNKKINILNDKKFIMITSLLNKKKLVKFDGKKFVYSSAGSYLINNIKIIGVAASYRNMLLNLKTYLLVIQKNL